eukprot:m.80056 g.80056  ORF g.80056 m.80056 type:complete len:80 (-) comp8197_c0_seq3:1342-1581(-)
MSSLAKQAQRLQAETENTAAKVAEEREITTQLELNEGEWEKKLTALKEKNAAMLAKRRQKRDEVQARLSELYARLDTSH